MAGSIIRLFNDGRRFKRFWDKLEVELDEACATELARDPSLNEGSLFIRLRERFTLYPVELGHLHSVTISAAATTPRGKADEPPMHRASARVSFRGSKELLQTAPEPGYRFPFPGAAIRHALLLHAALPDMDARAFTQAVEDELDRIRPVLKAFRPTVAEYDNRLRKRVELKIHTF